eukprot:jgi/Bigna1/91053/estExt_fgenesh1_pg.C_870013
MRQLEKYRARCIVTAEVSSQLHKSRAGKHTSGLRSKQASTIDTMSIVSPLMLTTQLSSENSLSSTLFCTYVHSQGCKARCSVLPLAVIADAAIALHVLTRFTDHRGAVLSMAFSPDGERVVTGERGSNVIFWCSTTGSRFFDIRPPNPRRTVCSTGFSSDGKLVVSAGFDKSAFIWDASTGELRNELGCASVDLGDWLYSASFSENRVAFGCFSGTMQVWTDLMSRSPRLVLSLNNRGAVHSVCFSPDGRYLASAMADGSVRIWEIENRIGPGRVGITKPTR